MLAKEEYIKKIKTKIKRTKTTVTSWYNGMDITSKIKDLDVDIVIVDNFPYFDITIKQIEIKHEIKNVNHHFLFRPMYSIAEIKECDFLTDSHYTYDYLMNVNSYDMWASYFRECIWNIAKALRKENIDGYIE